MTTITRTNSRDRLTFLLVTDENGTPKCPHCGARMSQSKDVFENSNCPCWWVGAQEGICPLQVVVSVHENGDAVEIERISEIAKKDSAEKAQQAATVSEIGALLENEGWVPRATLKEKWAGHWSNSEMVAIIIKTPVYGGRVSFEFLLGTKSGQTIVRTTDLSEFLESFASIA